jgi:hypothetical protein
VTKYLLLALIAALLSVVAAGLVLGVVFGFNPLGLSILPNLGSVADTGERAAVVSAVASLSAAISTVLALMVGAIAVTALIVSERSETRAVEQLKLDIASLATTLLSLRDRALLYTQPDAIDVTVDPFKAERTALSKILTSPTGLAIYWWSKQPTHKQHSDLYPSIAGLVDLTTLDLNRYFAESIPLITDRSQRLLARIGTIEERQFKEMCYPLSHLSDGLRHIRETVGSDDTSIFVDEWGKARAAAYRAPTEDELTILKNLADKRIGGQSADTVEHFGRAAITGSDEDREKFHTLITKLLGVDLDELAAAQKVD